jgi:hypothetical protein
LRGHGAEAFHTLCVGLRQYWFVNLAPKDTDLALVGVEAALLEHQVLGKSVSTGQGLDTPG